MGRKTGTINLTWKRRRPSTLERERGEGEGGDEAKEGDSERAREKEKAREKREIKIEREGESGYRKMERK